MGYDYNLAFLERRKDDIAMIETCYKNRTPFSQTFDYPNECVRARININNVLRSLALHYPEQYGHVRKVVRTRVDPMPNGKWRLTVYPSAPGEKIEGRPPGQVTRTSWEGMTDRKVVIGSEYTFPDLIDTEAKWLRLIEEALEAQKEVKKIMAEFAGDLDLPMMTEVFAGEQHKPEDRWRVSANGPSTLVLERD